MTISVLARTFTAHLPGCLLGGAAIAMFAWILLRLAKGQNSGTRFGIWLSALLAIALLFVGGVRQPWANPGLHPSAVAARVPIELPASWALYIFAFWVMCSCLVAARLCLGLWQLRRLRHTCVPLDLEQVAPTLRDTLNSFHRIRRVTLCVSDRVTVPVAVGFFRPAVVIPSWLMRELAPSELNQVVLHELAHLERWDDWTNLLQKLLGAILFFHPVVWWVERKLSLERENACDDFVLSRTEDPTAYARCLAALAEKTLLRRSLALAQAAVSRLGPTALRVSRILRITRPGTTRLWKPGLSLVAVFSFACLLYQWHAPSLVAFRENVPVALPASSISRPVLSDNVAAMRQPLLPQLQSAAARPGKTTPHSAQPVSFGKASPDRVAPNPYTPYVHNAGLVFAKAPALPVHQAVSGQAVSETFVVVIDSQQNTLPNGDAWNVTVWHVVICSSPPPARKAVLQKST